MRYLKYSGICVAVLLLALEGWRHETSAMDSITGFYIGFSVLAGVLLVGIARALRHWLMRDEDYYR